MNYDEIFESVRLELEKFLKEEKLKNATFMVLGNKKDLK